MDKLIHDANRNTIFVSSRVQEQSLREVLDTSQNKLAKT